MDAFWDGFEKRASRVGEELAKRIAGKTPRALSKPFGGKLPLSQVSHHGKDMLDDLKQGFKAKQRPENMTALQRHHWKEPFEPHQEYAGAIKAQREKLKPAREGSSLKKRLAKFKQKNVKERENGRDDFYSKLGLR